MIPWGDFLWDLIHTMRLIAIKFHELKISLPMSAELTSTLLSPSCISASYSDKRMSFLKIYVWYTTLYNTHFSESVIAFHSVKLDHFHIRDHNFSVRA